MKKLQLFCFFLFPVIHLLGQAYQINDDFSFCHKGENHHLHDKSSNETINQSYHLWDYDVKFYFLDLKVENNTVEIEGNVTIMAAVEIQKIDTFVFELVDELNIDSVIFNNQSKSFFRLNNEVFVPIDQLVEKGDVFTAQIFYWGTPPSQGFFSGVSTDYDDDWEKNVTWTLSEPFNARQWWPTKQVLTDKADSVWVYLTTNDQNKAGSIGMLTNIITLPNNKVRFEWKSNYPIDYYLISFAVSEYQEYNIYAHPDEMGSDSLLIQNYIYNTPGCLESFKEEIDRTIDLIEFFSDKYSLYPFYKEKYGHCLTTLSGGMEHQTMTTLGHFGLGLVSHELGHMWFGDHVTCADWSDIWINEGFATYTTYLTYELVSDGGWDSLWRINNHKRVISEPDGSIYIPPEEIFYENEYRIFDGRLSYTKGAYLLHMIRFELQNDELFFQVFKDFQNAYSNSVATGNDFLFILNSTTGQNFDDFFDQWYYYEGHPIYDFTWFQTETEIELYSIQHGSCENSPSVFKMHYPLHIYYDNGKDSVVILNQNSTLETFHIPFHQKVDSIMMDPDNHVLKEVNSITHLYKDDNILPKIMIAPNPASDQIKVFISENIQSGVITITDLNGQSVFNENIDKNFTLIDIVNLSSGIYLLNYSGEGKSFTKKFIKMQ